MQRSYQCCIPGNLKNWNMQHRARKSAKKLHLMSEFQQVTQVEFSNQKSGMWGHTNMTDCWAEHTLNVWTVNNFLRPFQSIKSTSEAHFYHSLIIKPILAERTWVTRKVLTYRESISSHQMKKNSMFFQPALNILSIKVSLQYRRYGDHFLKQLANKMDE